MCGIAGLIEKKAARFPTEVLEQMSLKIAHRGPDGSGLKVYAEETNGIPNKTDEQYFFNVILKRCIIIYYVLLAIILIWKFNQ